jgi:hypothetical protein
MKEKDMLEVTGILADIRSHDPPPTTFTDSTRIFGAICRNEPILDLSEYITEYNLAHQTPLMYASLLDRIEYVRQLLPYDVGRIDDYEKNALDYATPGSEISKLLQVVEYIL